MTFFQHFVMIAIGLATTGPLLYMTSKAKRQGTEKEEIVCFISLVGALTLFLIAYMNTYENITFQKHPPKYVPVTETLYKLKP